MGMEQPPPPPTPGEEGPRPPDLADMGRKLQAAQGPDRLLLIAGFLFFVATFLPWWRVRIVGFAAGSGNAWNTGGIGVLAALLGLATLVFAAASITGMLKPNPSFGLLALVLGGGTLLFTLLRFLFKPGADTVLAVTVKVSRGIGLWAALILAILMALAAFQKYQSSNA